MGNYPIINPSPIDQANPLVCSFAGHGATASQIDVCAADLAELITPLGALLGYEDVAGGHLTYQLIDGLVHCYNFDGTLTALERAALRLDLQSALYGNPVPDNAAALCSADGWMPGFLEETSWCAYFTNQSDVENSQVCTGDYASTAGYWAWQVQIWSQIWTDHINAGLIPPGSRWTVRAVGEPSAPWGYIEGYGLDVVENQAAIATAAFSMANQLSGWMTDSSHPLVDPC